MAYRCAVTTTIYPPFQLVIINDIIARVDDLAGERQSRFFQSKLEYLDDKQRCSYVEESRFLLCSGQLKTNRGTVSKKIRRMSPPFEFLLLISTHLFRNCTFSSSILPWCLREMPLEAVNSHIKSTANLSHLNPSLSIRRKVES